MADAARALVAAVGWATAGVVAWSLAEYVLHRWDMHGRRSRGATCREHRRHHATADVPVITAGTWVGAALVAVFLGWAAHPAAGAGWMAAYVSYELLHRHLHATAPTSALGEAPADERASDRAGRGTTAARGATDATEAAAALDGSPDDERTSGHSRREATRATGATGAIRAADEGAPGTLDDGSRPRTRLGWYGRWARGHHFHHHFVDARVNYGVTSPVWDVVLRTRRR
jgi:hypothetical protein